MRFSAFVYVADEEEGVAKIDVLRLGLRVGYVDGLDFQGR